MLIDAIEGLWNTILETTSLFVLPDWASLIGLLPILIFLGVVGPLLTFTALGIFLYQVRKPRIKVSYEEGPRKAELDESGQPIFPPGHPHCRRDALIYASGIGPLRRLPRRPGRDLPDVRRGPQCRDRYLRELRPRPEDRDPPVGRSPRPPEAGRRGRRLSPVKPTARQPRP